MIDLRSDTVTKPTPDMLKYMMEAEVGDDVYKEDPSVNQLEEYMANLFGMDAALYFPTGTMANQAAIKLLTNPSEQLICDKWAHVYNYEGGGVAFNSGVSCKLIDGDRGKITADQVQKAINPPDFYHSPMSTLVCLENTTNKGGGACYHLDEIKAIKKVCDENDLKLHLDGARLFNAIVANNHDPKEFGALFDTISICLSKGLGAPMGTILLGKKEVMQNAMRVRKVLGGGMRQVGFAASAAYYALHHHVDRMVDDHRRAKEISNVLKTENYVSKVEKTETNIVIFYLNESVIKAAEFLSYLENNKIRISTMGEGKMRIVTHLDYSEGDHQKVLEVLKK
ncbi:MAG: threonine aldolase family protein [Psychroflexus sp.]|uniref:threonine aldolase family protein n=1 Tax=Psychroflexus sp. S27 TaxID=1982757 RepID=UPI000C2A6605|nr:GntG family PLP-dependent aldolase [Psychroflexus sp. S27]PJX24658.1 threonine aldolase [Psychroflexus sp. S27]